MAVSPPLRISHRVAPSELPSFLEKFGASDTLKVQAVGN